MEQGNGLRSLDDSGSVGATGPEPLSFKLGENVFTVEEAFRLNEMKRIEMEQRIFSLEQDRERFMKALHGAIGMLLENPMASAMMPKQMKCDLRAYLELNGNGTTPQI